MIDYHGCMKKECTKCGEVKAFGEYYKDNSKKDGLLSYCKCCRNQYITDNKNTVACRQKMYREKNKERTTAYNIQYYNKNKEIIAEKGKQYREANKETIAERKQKYQKDRRANDPVFRMINSLRSGLGKAMNGTAKCKKTMELLGCSRKQLRKHLSAQFTEGMTLENYGADGWVIDHIIPVSHFDHKDQKQVEVCWHYTNMQPLWDRDNLIKSDMLPHEWEAFKASGTTMESCPS